MTSTEPYLLIEQCGSKYGRLIYVITEHIPASGEHPASVREIRCMDLGKTALGNWKAQQGGCTHIQVRLRVFPHFAYPLSQRWRVSSFSPPSACILPVFQ
ncbi:hypothetical protein EDB85DRAFT_1914351 [Lactarius pseudohatsudake]|nr:hypothetical protein EDB85DRAFT_1914351 [Lactarius pseudohatsudake]